MNDTTPHAYRHLILMRHAEAVNTHPKGNKARPLTPEGHRHAFTTATLLKKIGATPDVLVLSPSIRTEETNIDMMQAWETGPRTRRDDRLFQISHHEGKYAEKFDLLAEFNNILTDGDGMGRCTMVLGHNPAIDSMAHITAAILPDELKHNFPTSTAVVLRIPNDNTVPLIAKQATCTHVIYNDEMKGVRLITMPDQNPAVQPAPEVG